MARKITFKEDLAKISALKAPENELFVGSGFDVHEFEKGRPLVLCGEKIDYEFGLKAHSDGDAGTSCANRRHFRCCWAWRYRRTFFLIRTINLKILAPFICYKKPIKGCKAWALC